MGDDLWTKIARKLNKKSNGIAIIGGNGNLKELRELTERLSKHKDSKSAMEINNLEALYRCIVQHKQDVIMLTKPDGVIAYLSSNCIDILGWDAHELTNRVPWIVYNDDLGKVKENFYKALNGGSGINSKYRIITKNNEIRNISHTWTPLYMGGELYLIISVLKLTDN